MRKLYSFKTIPMLLLLLSFLMISFKEVNAQQVTVFPAHPAAGDISLGGNDNIIGGFFVSVDVNEATLTSFSVQTAGTYQTTDIMPNGFKLWRAGLMGPPVVIAQSAVVASGGTLTFTGLSETINSNDGAQFLISVDIAANAVAGRTISLAAAPASNFVFTPNNTTSTLTASNTQTIRPAINLFSSTSPDRNVAPGSAGVRLFSFYINSQSQDATLNSFSLTTTGTYQLSDLATNPFKLYLYNEETSSSTLLATLPAVATGGTLSFPGLNILLEQGGYYDIYLNVDLSPTAVTGRSIGITSTPLTNFAFDQTYKVFGNDPLNAGGVVTVQTPAVTISSAPVAAGNISPGSVAKPVYIVRLLSENSGAAISQVTFTTSGTYQTSDVAAFKLYGGDQYGFYQLLGTATSVASGSTIVFTLPNVSIDQDEIVYAYLTVDLSPTAVVGRTISIQPITTSNITLTAGTKTGGGSAGGVQTIAATSVAFTPAGPAAGNVSPGTFAILHSSQVNVTGANATFNGATFSTSGTYQPADIAGGVYLVYHRTTNPLAELQEEDGSAYILSYVNTTPTSGSTLTFPVLPINGEELISSNIPTGIGYITAVAELSNTAVVGRTIQLSATSTANYTLASGTKTGTVAAGGTQTIGTPTIAISAVTTPSVSVVPGTKAQIYAARLDVTSSSAVLENLALTTAGTYQGFDVNYFELYLSADNVLNLTGANEDETIGYANFVNSGGTINFEVDNGLIPVGTYYLFATATISNNPATGNTISVTATPTSAFDFVSGTVTGTSPLAAGGTITILAPATVAATFTTLSPGTITAGSDNNLVYSFSTVATGEDAVFLEVEVITSGTYDVTDFQESGLKLWYNTTNSVAGSTLLDETDVEPSGENDYLQAGNLTTPEGQTLYFFITADVSDFASNGATFTLNVEDVVFAGLTPTGTPAAGATFTINSVTSLIGKRSVKETVVYPNPSSQQDVVNISSSNSQHKLVTVYTSTGVKMRTYEMNGNLVQLEDLEKGMYVIIIQNLMTNKTETQKLIVE